MTKFRLVLIDFLKKVCPRGFGICIYIYIFDLGKQIIIIIIIKFN